MSTELTDSPESMRKQIIVALEKQGFEIKKGRICPPPKADKDAIRRLHHLAVEHRVERAKAGLVRHEHRLLKQIADGARLEPEAIEPELVEVRPKSEEELLFRWAALHWSIPVSSGYGRRLRFIVRDAANGKLMGIIGLGDPVFGLGVRDQWVGWDLADRRERLNHVLDAFVLGAVPPYSGLLCGKLVAMLASSAEVAAACKRKYGGREALISGKRRDGRLALVTTSSALGRSSVYNRLRLGGEPVAISLGYTLGSGEFHFSNGLYATISAYAERHCEPSAKQEAWGSGYRSRREVVRKVLHHLEMSDKWIYHGVEREVFALPLAENSREFLRGEHTRLRWHHRTVESTFAEFRERWLLPRASRDDRYKLWNSQSWRLWG